MPTVSVTEVAIRPAVRKDLHAVSSLEELCFKDPYPPYFISQLAEANPDTFLVAEVNGGLVGYTVADRWMDHDHLVSIAVHPGNRRTRIGERLLLALEARLGTARPFKLEVRKSNFPALELYRKHGFQETDVILGYYSDGEDAIAMEKRRGQSIRNSMP